ncbi:MAG: aminotransferase class IV [Bacteroidota bacterium]
MIHQINLNGQLVSTDQAVFKHTNRSFRYGDGLFESIRMFEGRIPFLEFHLRRLHSGMAYLKMQIPETYNADFFLQEIKKVTGDVQNSRIRLTVFREDGGLFLPPNNSPNFMVEAAKLKGKSFKLDDQGLIVGVADDYFTPSSFANLKTNNALPYILGKIEAEKKGLDELILFNQNGCIVEGTANNIFVVLKNVILTPALSEGCLDGVMRHFILKNKQTLGLSIREAIIPVKTILTAKEIWLTNAIQGLNWIQQIDGTTYSNTLAKSAVGKINHLIKGSS